jgi:hypothetical protein
MGITTKIDLSNFKLKMTDLAQVEKKAAPQIYQYFKDITPIRSGNARRNTFLKNLNIEADYAYAGKLDTGYSRQAPSGMTVPTERFAQKLIPQLIRQIGARRK